jgi:malate dehydrogenase (oxaloacetate-decarboxylating)
MLCYVRTWDPEGNRWIIFTALEGKELLKAPLLNKGTAFTYDERKALRLLGKLPYRVETLDEQILRAYEQYHSYSSTLQKYIYLNDLHDKNEVLFYRLLQEHLGEMLPMIYTPTVGEAVQSYSRQFRQPRGLFISYPDRASLDTILDNRTHADISVITVTDAEGVLGIGDQGVGGIDIPVAKQIVYSVCGVDPYKALPIILDVGTDNLEQLNDPFYLGWRHPRLRGAEYRQFIEDFVCAVQKKFPGVFLHWEDFGRDNARWILERYRERFCMFNDDMQGTGVVALAALLAGIRVSGRSLREQRVVVFGAGTAGMGIVDRLCGAMQKAGLSEKEARACFYLLDRQGVLTEESTDIQSFHRPYLRPAKEAGDLAMLVARVHPTVLIGTSSVRGAFTEDIVRSMAEHCEYPFILPLSNPTEHAEAIPEHLFRWTEGRVIVASGSPFAAVEWEGQEHHIAQCNNALAFPGIALGVLAARASSLTENMLFAASEAISDNSPMIASGASKGVPLLPPLSQLREVAQKVAHAIIKAAIDDGVAGESDADVAFEHLTRMMWKPDYCAIQKAPF